MYANLAGEQINPPWHLDRVDQRDLPLDQVYRWRDDADGTDVEIFVLDTYVSFPSVLSHVGLSRSTVTYYV